jgi:hypothetical protein
MECFLLQCQRSECKENRYQPVDGDKQCSISEFFAVGACNIKEMIYGEGLKVAYRKASS